MSARRRRLKNHSLNKSRVACIRFLSGASGSHHWAELTVVAQMLLLVSFIDLSIAATKRRPAANLGGSQVIISATNKQRNKH